MIVKLAKSKEMPSLCSNIGHCKARLPSFLKAGRVGQTGRCTICQYVMGILDEALEGHMTKQKIISKIHQLCNKLPREIFKTECNAIIGEYGGELINLIVENYLKPKDACQHFGLC